MKDEDLQKRIESGENPANADEEAYRYVFDGFKREPEFQLPPYFADRVMQMVADRNQRILSPEFIWLALGIAVLMTGAGVVAYWTNFSIKFSINLGFLSGMSSYSGLLIFGVVFIGLLNWFDKKYLKNHQRTA